MLAITMTEIERTIQNIIMALFKGFRCSYFEYRGLFYFPYH